MSNKFLGIRDSLDTLDAPYILRWKINETEGATIFHAHVKMIPIQLARAIQDIYNRQALVIPIHIYRAVKVGMA
jgi:hypothetical protein